MTAWTDAHNHLQDPRLGDPAPVIAAMRAAGVGRCVVNATREADWPAVEKLALDHPDFVLPAFGIHPWHAHTAGEGWEKRLKSILEKHPAASIGECGLDQWVSSPPIEVQVPVFLTQVRLARLLDRPLTIHCLKAWEPLFDAFEQQAPPHRFLMHSFGGSIETARRLIPLGAYFSCSGHFLSDRKKPALDVFRKLPTDRLLLESDAPDMRPPEAQVSHPLPAPLNHPANLPSIGRAFASAFGIDADEFRRITRENARNFFS